MGGVRGGWESPPAANAHATPSQIEQLPAREGWPPGTTSDDTALTLLVAHHLADRDGDGDPAAFLAELAGQEPAIRGLGPTTTAAIERFRHGDATAASSGKATNGAAMRALPIGWVLPTARPNGVGRWRSRCPGPPTATLPRWSLHA